MNAVSSNAAGPAGPAARRPACRSALPMRCASLAGSTAWQSPQCEALTSLTVPQAGHNATSPTPHASQTFAAGAFG